MTLHVLIAEDSPVVQETVRALLESANVEVVGQALDGEEAVRLADAIRPDVVVLDHSMPRLNGLEAARAIRRNHSDACMVMLTMTTSAHHIAAAFNAGVRGYVAKADAGEDLLRAIEAVSRGAMFVSPTASKLLGDCYLPDV